MLLLVVVILLLQLLQPHVAFTAGLVAVQTLVSTFVLAHNGLVSRLASSRHYGNQLQQQVDQLETDSLHLSKFVLFLSAK